MIRTLLLRASAKKLEAPGQRDAPPVRDRERDIAGADLDEASETRVAIRARWFADGAFAEREVGESRRPCIRYSRSVHVAACPGVTSEPDC